jgi:hypothetical protein
MKIYKYCTQNKGWDGVWRVSSQGYTIAENKEQAITNIRKDDDAYDDLQLREVTVMKFY